MSYNTEEGTLNGEPWDRTEVWWQVPLRGLFSDREEAVSAAREIDLDPKTCVRPCPVAIKNEKYEILM